MFRFSRNESEPHWQRERTDDRGIRTQALLCNGEVVAMLTQPPEDAPTTYVDAKGKSATAYPRWEEAKRATMAAANSAP